MAVAPGAVFLSYRRQDTGQAAGRIDDRLTARFGRPGVFTDVETIRPGEGFADAITRAVGSCRVLLALIGPRWTTIEDEDGRRRLDDPDDFVVLEIATALSRGVIVIPVLVDGAPMPTEADVPSRLRDLPGLQARRIDQDTFPYAVAGLLDDVARIVGARPRWVRPVAVTTVVVAGVVAGVVALNPGGITGTAGAAGTTQTTGSASDAVVLQPVEDNGRTVQLTWSGPTDLDYAVVVAVEGQGDSTTRVGRVTTSTVAVDPTARYCIQVRATDGATILSSNVQPLRGASCPPG
jgi:hypothetical protein